MPKSNPLVLSIDAGTTSVRCIVFDPSGQIITQSQEALNLSFPQPGWVETDPEILWKKVIKCMLVVWEKLGKYQKDVIGIGITNQRETIVAWDATTGRALYSAISWQDRRTAERCKLLSSSDPNGDFSKMTGLIYDPYFSCSKTEWLLSHVDNVKQAMQSGQLRVGTIDTWLIWKFSQGANYLTDPTNACRTGFYNINTQQWDSELISLWNVDKLQLADIIQNNEIACRVKINGFPELPLASIIGDQQAAAYGHRCEQPGQVKNTYGTGCFLVYILGSELKLSSKGLITTVAISKSNEVTYAWEGSIFVAGALVEWMIRNKWLEHIDELEQIYSSSLVENCNVFFVPAFTGLGVPYWDSKATGMLIGLTLGTTREDLVCAALNSITFQVQDLIGTISVEIGEALDELLIDGGLTRLNSLLQFQSDISNLKIIKKDIVDVTAWGAARLAFENLNVETKAVQEELNSKVFEPHMDDQKRNHLLVFWKEAIQRAMNWL